MIKLVHHQERHRLVQRHTMTLDGTWKKEDDIKVVHKQYHDAMQGTCLSHLLPFKRTYE